MSLQGGSAKDSRSNGENSPVVDLHRDVMEPCCRVRDVSHLLCSPGAEERTNSPILRKNIVSRQSAKWDSVLTVQNSGNNVDLTTAAFDLFQILSVSATGRGSRRRTASIDGIDQTSCYRRYLHGEDISSAPRSGDKRTHRGRICTGRHGRS